MKRKLTREEDPRLKILANWLEWALGDYTARVMGTREIMRWARKMLCELDAASRDEPKRKSVASDLVLTIGRLNYAEREFVSLCRKANTFPGRIWLKF